MQEVFSILAGVIFVFSYIPYIRDILCRKTSPSKATWVIWAILDLITLYTMFLQGVLNGQIVGATAGSCVVALLSLFYGKSGWTHIDRWCLVGVFLGTIFWQLTAIPMVGLVTGLALMVVGAIPTFINSWSRPEDESKRGWTLMWISCLFAAAAIPSWTFGDMAQPITFLGIESVMMYLLFIHARQLPLKVIEDE